MRRGCSGAVAAVFSAFASLCAPSLVPRPVKICPTEELKNLA